MKVEIVPFHVGLLPAAAELLAARHARDRQRQPLLPARFEQPRTANAAAREVWGVPNSSGVAAWHDGRLVGYLIGQARFDTLRGRHAWIQLPGHALAADAPPGLYADLYAAAAPAWLALGAFDHYVMLPAGDRDALDVWFSLSFGQEQAHAMRSLAEPLPGPVELPGVIIRRATPDDRDAFVEEMAPLVARHMTGPPVWGVALPEATPERREGFAELLTDENVFVWLAERDEADGPAGGRILGYQAYLPASPSDDNLTIPLADRTVALEVGATRPEARGRGIGRALSAVGLAAAAAAGYRVCVADWRTTNLEAQRFWPAMGFRPAVYRLTRKVDPRIAWARI